LFINPCLEKVETSNYKTMKKTALYLAIVAILTVNVDLFANEQPDSVIELDGSVDISRMGDGWLKISVPFLLKSHPDLETLGGRKPSSMEELFNPDFIDNLNLKITVCFRNEFKRKYARGDKNDIQFFDYYSSELEIKLLKVDRNTKTAVFLLPSMIAERDEFVGSSPKAVGYVLEFSRGGTIFKVSDSIVFEKYSNEEILEKFKSEAQSRSLSNEGFLIPAHLIDSSFLKNLGPVSWEN
jgi:hypothetical protein